MNKIAVWGLGKHSIKNILPALDKSDNLFLHGLYSRDRDIRNTYSNEYNCISYDNEGEMLSDNDLEIIYVATPPGLHYEQGKCILESGKHFWCEKPFVTNLNEAQDIIQIAEKNDLSIAEGLMYLYHPQFEFIKTFLDSNKKEDIKIINSLFTLPHTNQTSFRYDPKLGGSSLMDVGIYPISIIHELLGDEESELLLKKNYSEDGYSIDTSGFAVFQFKSGIICNAHWGMGSGYRNELDILTANSSIYTNKIFSKPENFSPKIIIKDKFGSESEINCDSNNHFLSMFDYFVKFLSSKRERIKEKDRLLKLSKILDKIKD